MLRLSWLGAEPQKEDVENCLHASQHAPYITFTPDDMQVRGNMVGPFASQGILDCLKCHIHMDPGSAWSIIPRRVMQHLGISTHRLSAIQTAIYSFNANGTRPMGKIKLKC